MSKSKVAVLKTSAATVLADYQKLPGLADMSLFLDKNRTTILKDNISWHYPFPGANTTPWQLEGTVNALHKAGYGELVAVHNNTVVTNACKGGERNNLTPVYKKYGIQERYNFIEGDIKWVELNPRSELSVLPAIFPHGIRIPEYFIRKNIVHLPTMKCHIYTTTTGAMKNAFGGLLNRRRHYTHSVIHETLVDLLAIQKEIHSGLFAIMDGTTAGNGPGPRTMRPVEANYILASGDQVALDAVASKMMGFDPMQIDYIRLADERGLGHGRLEQIEVVGEDITGVNLRFSVGDNLASRFGDLLWFSPLRAVQKLLFRTPLVYLFVFGSWAYHDWFWWPLHGRRIFNKWQKESQWGRLFASSQKVIRPVKER